MANDPFAAARSRRHRERNARIEHLAELVAEGWSVSAAARHLGFSQQAGSKMWRDIRAELGDQAI